MEKRYISTNGTLQEASIPLFTGSNRGFRYGDGIFESMRFYNGRVLFADKHVQRLLETMNFLKFTGNDRLDVDWLQNEASRLAHRNKVFKTGRMRLSIYRSGSGFYTPFSNNFEYVLELDKLDQEAYQLNEPGLLIDLYKEVIIARNALSRFKTSNALPYVLAGISATERGLDESILINEHGNLVEGISANVFLVKNGKIYTPPVLEGCIEGVMRSVLIDIFQQHELKFQEVPIPQDALEEADEVFLSNTISGIKWVVGYRQKRYFNQVSRKLVELLNNYITL